MNPSDIREQMKVIGSDRQPVGTVDKVEGDRIKLSRNDPQAQGKHHFIPTEWVSQVEGQQVVLKHNAQDACQKWQNG
jgi:hypothetical protein